MTDISQALITLNDVSLSYHSKGTLQSDEAWKARAPRAIKNISLDINHNDVIGLIGRNGAGKSTLAMLIAGTLIPDTGFIERNADVQLLSLGLGFNTQLSGRDNIFVSAALLGLSRKQIRTQIEEIVEFSELQDFIDAPLRTYSSGMRSRLAFAIATVIRPEVLILDEVLSTGDSSFRLKAEKRIAETRENAKAVVLVSHSEGQIRKLCNRVVWLEKGEIIRQGQPDEILSEYEAFSSAPNAWLKQNIV